MNTLTKSTIAIGIIVSYLITVLYVIISVLNSTFNVLEWNTLSSIIFSVLVVIIVSIQMIMFYHGLELYDKQITKINTKSNTIIDTPYIEAVEDAIRKELGMIRLTESTIAGGLLAPHIVNNITVRAIAGINNTILKSKQPKEEEK